MRTILIVLNLLIAAVAAGLFGYAFFAREHLVGLAEEFVVGKAVGYATSAVDDTEKALDAVLQNPAAAALIPAAARAAARAEFDSFHRDPHRYVRELVSAGAAVEKPKHPLADAVVRWKEQVRGYFGRTLDGVILDVRIFSGTTIVAALLAAWLAAKARGRWRYRVLALSVLLLLALGLHAYLFLDGLTFFRILFDWRVGWSYPLAVALTFGYLFVRIGRHVPLAAPESDPAGSADVLKVR